MARRVVGVVGPDAGASEMVCKHAYELGREIAIAKWVLLTGGRSEGVMDAASRGAKSEDGVTVGVLPSSDARGMSPSVDIPIFTGMGQARNNINVLSSEVIFVCGMGPGTAAEASLALKARRHIILVSPDEIALRFFKTMDPERTHIATDASEAIDIARGLLLRGD
jgi:uncharacterized protein (TIGR00725 family)